MTTEQTQEIEKILEEAKTSQNEENTPQTKETLLNNESFLKEKIKQIVAIKQKFYGKLAKTRKVVSAVVGAASGAYTGIEFVQIYNLFYDTSLAALYNQNNAELNQMKVDLLLEGVEPEKIHLPVFSENVREQLADFGIDETASSSQVILDAMSKGMLDFSTLDPTTGLQVAALVALSAVFAGFEVNNFLKNRIKRQEEIKIAKGEVPTFMQIEEEKKAKEEKKQAEKELKL